MKLNEIKKIKIKFREKMIVFFICEKREKEKWKS